LQISSKSALGLFYIVNGVESCLLRNIATALEAAGRACVENFSKARSIVVLHSKFE